MATINVEMMQQLLHEFSEKEALTGEEIKVIEQQVLELEARITVCRDRLQFLNEDKDRLAAMMSRYVDGINPPAQSLAVKGTSSKLKSVARLPDKQAGQTYARTTSTGQKIPAVSEKNSLIEDLEPIAEEESRKDEAGSKDAGSAGGDDAIKSINDALKGLFRK